MRETERTTTTSRLLSGRRSLFSSAAAVLAAIPVARAAALTPTSNSDQTPAGDDAELIALCRQFDAIERRRNALYDTIEDDNERDVFLTPLQAQQGELLDRICDLRATTAEGWRARAVMANLFAREIVEEDLIDGYWPERMLAALVRDLIGGGESPTPCMSRAGSDTELVATCAKHAGVIHALQFAEGDDGPEWAEYDRSRDFITHARPMTMDGILAKALVTRAEFHRQGGMAETWAQSIVSDLLRVQGGVL